MRAFFAVLLGVLGVLGSVGAESLKDFSSQTGAQVFWEPYRNLVLFSDSRHRLSVDLESGMALGDGETSFDLDVDPNTGEMSTDDFRRILAWWKDQPLAATSPPVAEPSKPAPIDSSGPRIQVIVLDPGHGGSDPGSIGRHVIDGKTVVLQEKDLTLAVVLELQKLLAQEYPDRTIVLTRQSDTYPTLEKRVEIADSQKLAEHQSIVFLSVHFNASLSPKARGLELWYVPQGFERDVLQNRAIPESVFPVLNTLVDSEYKKESRDLAVKLAKGLSQELGDDSVSRGLKENPWFVVRMARMPAVLAELGFITNPDEAKLFLDPEYLKKLARGLYNGLSAFIQSYEDHP